MSVHSPMSSGLSSPPTSEPPSTGPEGSGAGATSSSAVWRWTVRRRYTAISILSVLVVLGVWQVCADTGVVQARLTSSPWGVVQAARYLIDTGQLGSDIASSAALFGVGITIAIVIGGIGGVVIGWWRTVGAIFEPFIAMLYAMPLIALLPVILVWFGITFEAQIVMVVLISVFPVLVSVMTGTRHVDLELIRLARSFRASQGAIMRTVVLPSLVPYFITGIRLAIGGALVGVVVSEYFMGESGIGGLIVRAGDILDTGQVFVGVTILALVSVFLTSLLRALERRLMRWRA